MYATKFSQQICLIGNVLEHLDRSDLLKFQQCNHRSYDVLVPRLRPTWRQPITLAKVKRGLEEKIQDSYSDASKIAFNEKKDKYQAILKQEPSKEGQKHKAYPVNVKEIFTKWMDYRRGIYQGEVTDGLPDGFGMLLLPQSEMIQIGHFKQGVVTGNFTELYVKTGATDSVNYKDGKRHGQLTITQANGSVSKRHYKNGKFERFD